MPTNLQNAQSFFMYAEPVTKYHRNDDGGYFLAAHPPPYPLLVSRQARRVIPINGRVLSWAPSLLASLPSQRASIKLLSRFPTQHLRRCRRPILFICKITLIILR